MKLGFTRALHVRVLGSTPSTSTRFKSMEGVVLLNTLIRCQNRFNSCIDYQFMPCKDKEKQRQYLNGWRERKRGELRDRLGGKCAECGSVEELHFDHIDSSTKVMSIAQALVRMNSKSLEEEVDKCQLLCNSCHNGKSKREGSLNRSWRTKPRLVHGSKWTYYHHKCRCDVCMESHSRKFRHSVL